MDYLIAIIILTIFAFTVRRLFVAKDVYLYAEKAEVQANLESTLTELEELDTLISEHQKKKRSTRKKPLHLLKQKVASKRIAIKNTLRKMENEGEIDWGYRKLQAERTMESAQQVIDNETLPLSE